MPGRSKLGRDAMRGRASVADGRASDVPGLSRACCSARNAVPDVSGRDASIGLGLEESTTGQPRARRDGQLVRGVLLALVFDPSPELSVGRRREGPFPLPEGEELLEATEPIRGELYRVLPRGKRFEARAQARGWGLGFALQGLHGYRRGIWGCRLAGSLQCVIPGLVCRRGGVQRRALREAKGDGAADALRRWACSCLCGPPARLRGWRSALFRRRALAAVRH